MFPVPTPAESAIYARFFLILAPGFHLLNPWDIGHSSNHSDFYIILFGSGQCNCYSSNLLDDPSTNMDSSDILISFVLFTCRTILIFPPRQVESNCGSKNFCDRNNPNLFEAVNGQFGLNHSDLNTKQVF